jgi:hypothetical protein
MAWRIEDAVIRGELDNTVEGQTTGRIWLAGRSTPLDLSLDGDCWRDLAGTRLRFENPSPLPSPDCESLDSNQNGIIGDMTASRKVKVPTVTDEKLHELYQNKMDVPCEWRNTLYLEWFSESNGRVVIESTNFRLTISEHEWSMDEDAEEAQKLANLNSMRDFMAQVIRRRDPEGPEPETSGELDEFAWEERLKESDRLTDAYQEVLEKYMEDVDSEQKEAFVMGWDGLLDALADRDEAGLDVYPGNDRHDSPPGFQFSRFEEEDEDDDESFDEDEDEDEDEHPLGAMAHELAMRAMDVVERETGPCNPSYQLVTHLVQVSGKLASVLDGRGSGYEPETGFVLAVLKRCLNWLNDAVGACQQLIEKETDPDQRAALEHVLKDTFGIRESIIEMRRELK